MTKPLKQAALPAPTARRATLDDTPLLFELVAGGKSLRSACRDNGIDPASTYTFINSDLTLRQHYAHAKEQRGEVYQEEVLTIAKGAALGLSYDGRAIDAAGARVYIDAVKWAVGRMAPKSGEVRRLEMEVEIRDVTDEELDARVRAALAAPVAAEPIDAEFE